METLFSEKEIESHVCAVAKEVNEFYSGKELCVLVVLKGAYLFGADLLKKLEIPVTLDFLRVKSYVGTESSGTPTKIEMERDLSFFTGKNILLVEDIIDGGGTASFLMSELKRANPKSLRICSLLYKKRSQEKFPGPNFTSLLVGDQDFVIGYGLDYEEKYRHIPEVRKWNSSP